VREYSPAPASRRSGRPGVSGACIRPRPAVDCEHMFVAGHCPTDRGAEHPWT